VPVSARCYDTRSIEQANRMFVGWSPATPALSTRNFEQMAAQARIFAASGTVPSGLAANTAFQRTMPSVVFRRRHRLDNR